MCTIYTLAKQYTFRVCTKIKYISTPTIKIKKERETETERDTEREGERQREREMLKKTNTRKATHKNPKV